MTDETEHKKGPELASLFRPVGREEMTQIAASEFTAFPSLGEGEALFYPEITEEHARRIAHEWNEGGAHDGYITKFQVKGAYLKDREPASSTIGEARKYAIPVSGMAELNANIVGTIEVIAQHSGASMEEPERMLAMTASIQDLAFDLDEQEIPCKAGRHLVHEIRETFQQMHDENNDIDKQNAAAERLDALYKKAGKSHKDS